jgi:hypothetical protein
MTESSIQEGEHGAAVDKAARFLANTPPAERPKPLMPALKAMFGITAAEACEAIRESRALKRGAD